MDYESLIDDVEFENFNFNSNDLLQIPLNNINNKYLTLPEEFFLIILKIFDNNNVSSVPITNKALYFGLISLGVLELISLKKLGIQKEIKNGKVQSSIYILDKSSVNDEFLNKLLGKIHGMKSKTLGETISNLCSGIIPLKDKKTIKLISQQLCRKGVIHSDSKNSKYQIIDKNYLENNQMKYSGTLMINIQNNPTFSLEHSFRQIIIMLTLAQFYGITNSFIRLYVNKIFESSLERSHCMTNYKSMENQFTQLSTLDPIHRLICYYQSSLKHLFRAK